MDGERTYYTCSLVSAGTQEACTGGPDHRALGGLALAWVTLIHQERCSSSPSRAVTHRLTLLMSTGRCKLQARVKVPQAESRIDFRLPVRLKPARWHWALRFRIAAAPG